MNIRASLLFVFAAWPLGAVAVPVQKEFPPLLVESQEIAAALEAAPEHLRADAGVYVLTSMGYRRVRESRNGFNCLLERDLPGEFEPRCFDAEGSSTLLPVVFYRAEQRSRGATGTYIEREIQERYQKGEFVAPRRVGICYMLSPRNAVVANGKVSRVGPLLQFYAPNVSNADLGSTPDLESRILVIDEASAAAMIVVPVTSVRRTRINFLSPDDQTPLARSPDAAAAESDSRDSLNVHAEAKCGQNERDACTPGKADQK